jgi:hypothetical protein
MSSMTPLEHEVQRSLHAAADAVSVGDREFDPAAMVDVEVEPDEWPIRRHRIPRTALAAAAVVVVLVAGAVVVSQTGSSKKGSPVADSTTVPDTTPVTTPTPVDLATSVPTAVLDSVGAGTNSSMPVAAPGPALTNGGKPRVIWIGSEYCPYCAAERWPLIIALSRFGRFSDLGLTTSAAVTPGGQAETFPNTETFSFHGSTYASPYIEFDAAETEDRAYQPLDPTTPEEQELLTKYDALPYTISAGSIPFVDFANSYLSIGSTFVPSVLQGKTRAEIAAALSDPSTAIAKGIDGSANVITAVLCRLTDNQPAVICSDSVITTLEARLPHGA